MANIVKHMRVRSSINNRLQPPVTLSTPAKAIFQHIVASVDDAHFSQVDIPLLESYSNAAALGAEAAVKLDSEGAVNPDTGKVSPWLGVSEKCSKVLVALSARLRICPQSRYDRLVAGSNSRPQHKGKKPWQTDDDDGLLA